MGQIIAILVLVGLGWCYYNLDIDTDKIKQDTLNVFAKEKTINTINTRRSQEQDDIDNVTDRK